MEKIIMDMLDEVKKQELKDNYETAEILFDFTKRLVSKFNDTINCPSNWRHISDMLASNQEYSDMLDWEYGYY